MVGHGITAAAVQRWDGVVSAVEAGLGRRHTTTATTDTSTGAAGEGVEKSGSGGRIVMFPEPALKSELAGRVDGRRRAATVLRPGLVRMTTVETHAGRAAVRDASAPVPTTAGPDAADGDGGFAAPWPLASGLSAGVPLRRASGGRVSLPPPPAAVPAPPLALADVQRQLAALRAAQVGLEAGPPSASATRRRGVRAAPPPPVPSAPPSRDPAPWRRKPVPPPAAPTVASTMSDAHRMIRDEFLPHARVAPTCVLHGSYMHMTHTAAITGIGSGTWPASAADDDAAGSDSDAEPFGLDFLPVRPGSGTTTAQRAAAAAAAAARAAADAAALERQRALMAAQHVAPTAPLDERYKRMYTVGDLDDIGDGDDEELLSDDGGALAADSTYRSTPPAAVGASMLATAGCTHLPHLPPVVAPTCTSETVSWALRPLPVLVTQDRALVAAVRWRCAIVA